MRLRTRKALLNLVIFGAALTFVLLQQSWHSTQKKFAWNVVRYETAGHELPKYDGRCPGLRDTSKPALVVSHVASDGDLGWLDALADRYHMCVYEADAPREQGNQPLRVPANRGHEAMAYLTFLIDNYKDVPEAGAVFVHGSRFAWHNDDPVYDNLAILSALNVSNALALAGYHNLRCDWIASTCSPDYGPSQGSFETSMQSRLVPWDTRAISDAALPHALAVLFGAHQTRLGRADAVRAQCCAQFVVSRQRVWQHTREEYDLLRQWLLDGSAPADDRVSGRILSYVWHILFLRPEAASGAPTEGSSEGEADGINLHQLNRLGCPSAGECYCRLYGRCDLEGCNTPGQCDGMYFLPPDFQLPPNWAADHS